MRHDNWICKWTASSLGLLTAITFFTFITPASAHASTVLVRQSPVFGYGYTGNGWTTMKTKIDNAFNGGADVTVVSDYESATLTDYDALWVDLGNMNGQPNNTLSANEISKIESFASTGRRVVLVGENSSWTTWDGSILSIVGGSFTSEYDGSATTAYTHALTTSVSSIRLPTGGRASGGTSLFDQSVATLWGSSQNVLVMLDVNVWSDTYIGDQDNEQFAQNVANWIANGPQRVRDSAPTGHLGGPNYTDIVDWADQALCEHSHTATGTILKYAACKIVNGHKTIVRGLAANTNVTLKASVQYQDKAESVTIRVFGKTYTFLPSDQFGIYTTTFKTSQDPRTYPYTLTINYSGLTVSEKGLIVVR